MTMLPDELKVLDQSRLRAYRDNLDFYQGSQWLTTSRKERQLTFNYVKTGIDKLTSYMMSGMDFAVEPARSPRGAASGTGRPEVGSAASGTGRPETESARVQAAERALYAVYQDNGLEALDFDTEIDAAVLGDAAYKVTWDAQEKRVRVTSPDVQGLFAWWRADDPSTVYRVASRYKVPAEEAEARYGILPAGKQAEVVEDWTPTTFALWVVQQTARELNRALSQLSRILEVSGNPIAVLENVESSEDIAVQPNAVWNIPEGAKAYLLDLLEGGGIKLHVDYIDLLYRTLHDLSETPRAAFGGIERELSGVALEIELHPLLQKVRRKRTIRTAAYRKRALMILALLERYAGLSAGDVSVRIVWGQVLPQDRSRNAQSEQLLVQTGIHSRRRAMDDMGIMDPEYEFERWLEERRRILEMNQKLQARFSRGGQRERAQEAPNDETQA